MAVIASLVVKIKTSSTVDSGTDDEVYFGVGPRAWLLDNPTLDDFQTNSVDTFVLTNLDGLDVDDIRRIRLRKFGTDGWKPEWIKVFVNDPTSAGTPLYEGAIEVLLDGGAGAQQQAGLFWEASDFPKRYVVPAGILSQLVVQVTTADIVDGGTDDDVYFNIGTREWYLDNDGHDDFERGNTDTFTLQNLDGLRMTDIRQIGLRKEGVDGWFPSTIRVLANGPSPAFTEIFTDVVDMWLDGGAGSELHNGLVWNSRNYPQPAPLPVEDLVVSLRVVLETASETNAGTDDDVYFTIGTREWNLDNVGVDDFEEGATDTFDLLDLQAMGGLRISDIRMIGLRKTGLDAWRPTRISVFVNGSAFYSGPVDTWLDGGAGAENQFGLTWEARDYAYEIPVHGHLVVGPTVRPARSPESSAELLTNLNTEAPGARTQQGSANAYWSQGAVSFRVVDVDEVHVADADALQVADVTAADFQAMRDLAVANNKPDGLNIYFVRNTLTGSNWHLGGTGKSCWVKDVRNGGTVNTDGNFRQVAVSTSHEIGHFFGLPHSGANKFLMTGSGTNASSQLVSRAEVASARANAKSWAE